MSRAAVWKSVIVGTVLWKYRIGLYTCEAKHDDVTITANTRSIIGVTKEELADLIRRRRLTVRTVHIKSWLSPHSLKVLRKDQFR